MATRAAVCHDQAVVNLAEIAGRMDIRLTKIAAWIDILLPKIARQVNPSRIWWSGPWSVY